MPGALVWVVVAVLVARLLKLDIHYVIVPDNIWSVVQFPALENLKQAFETFILIAAVSLAFIASTETLLCASVVDQMHPGARTKQDIKNTF
ncbi:MAG: hypothetical protein HOP23_10415 [Methylococcaceae bacterium]|nr:hypothetical protein [Methylococcaceae bacterium]